jgi:CDP-paratose 2-epimerase
MHYTSIMATVLVTGSCGLIGNESVRFFAAKGFDVIGIDNNFRFQFFGRDGDTNDVKKELQKNFKNYKHFDHDIRNFDKIEKLFKRYGNDIKLIIHAAAQPSHDWAAKDPILDFEVNSKGTLNLLECTRRYSPEATFIYMSTNKVYGDSPNRLNYVETPTRFSPIDESVFYAKGFDEQFSVDQSLHSLFGVNKLSADVLTQEYGRYFGIKTTCLRGGCLSGPTHKGAELHGFLSYLVKCAVNSKKYTIFGYKGKQVRDNLHSKDVVSAFWEIYSNPKSAEVYNLGGGTYSNISILEAIDYLSEKGFDLDFEVSKEARKGDHKWWISNVSKFEKDYPNWKVTKNSQEIIQETIDALLNL